MGTLYIAPSLEALSSTSSERGESRTGTVAELERTRRARGNPFLHRRLQLQSETMHRARGGGNDCCASSSLYIGIELGKAGLYSYLGNGLDLRMEFRLIIQMIDLVMILKMDRAKLLRFFVGNVFDNLLDLREQRRM